MTQLLTKKEVAKALGVNVRTLERLRIPRVTLPGSGPKKRAIVRYEIDAVEEYLELHRTKKKRKAS